MQTSVRIRPPSYVKQHLLVLVRYEHSMVACFQSFNSVSHQPCERHVHRKDGSLDLIHRITAFNRLDGVALPSSTAVEPDADANSHTRRERHVRRHARAVEKHIALDTVYANKPEILLVTKPVWKSTSASGARGRAGSVEW